MEDFYEIPLNGITVVSAIPLLTIARIGIAVEENQHIKAIINASVRSELLRETLGTYFDSSRVTMTGEDGRVLFNGMVEQVEFRLEGSSMEAIIICAASTILLDRVRKRRSFQEPGLTYRQVISRVLKPYGNAGFQWQAGEDRAIGCPIIQYDETDWMFLKRLASHFHTVLSGNGSSGDIFFTFGIWQGEQKEAAALHISKYGIRTGPTGGKDEENKEPAEYIEAETEASWEVGDAVFYERKRYVVCRQNIVFCAGAMKYTCLLGTGGFTYTRREANEKLAGAFLTGTVKRTEQESVFLELEISREDAAGYPWPWSPETGNLCYCMPETGTEAVLYFPRDDEREGIVVHALQGGQGGSVSIEERGIQTGHGKKIGLYLDKLFLEGSGGMASLEDSAGIRLESKAAITMEASKGIFMKGKASKVTAPLEIVCRTSQSNIELNRDFNFYAPGGVHRKPGKALAPMQRAQASIGRRPRPDHWQMSYTAMAAVPAVDFAKGDKDSAIDLMTCGAIPKIGGGAAAMAMTEVMAGKKEADVSTPSALMSMDMFTVKGGYALPPSEKESKGEQKG